MLFLAERVNIMEFNETMKINLEFDKEKEVREIVAKVYEALKIKGYDPISQIVGYILSGDPTLQKKILYTLELYSVSV